MKELRFTLHEILGYLLPGVVTLLAIISSLWGIYWQTLDVGLVNRLSRREIILLFLLAYFLGHAVQAIGNFVEGVLSSFRSVGALQRSTHKL